MTAPAQWDSPSITPSIGADGSLVVVGEVTDAVTGLAGRFTVTLTTGRVLTCLSEGLQLADFRAWSAT